MTDAYRKLCRDYSGTMENSSEFIAGSHPELTHWDRVARIEAAKFVFAWFPSRDERWWADTLFAASKSLPILFAEPDSDSLGSNSPFLTFARLRGHMLHHARDEESALLIARAMVEHDPGFKAEGMLWSAWLADILRKVESPIEARLACHLYGAIRDRTTCDIENQVPLLGGAYRADFVVHNERVQASEALQKALGYEVPVGPIRIVVEADGHDFHERTKEQAARDKKRDRDLQIDGWTVLRFTGREIWTGAASCAEQILDCVEAKGGRI